ncbi:MAG: hypothetical protein P8Z74_15670 [Acidobacteriota bacterium]
MRTLERTFRRRVPPQEVVTTELAGHLAAVSRDLDRQVGVLLTRDGQVRNVIVGDARSLEIPEIGRLRGAEGRLRGLRLVHTHLKGESLTDDDLNDLALLRLDPFNVSWLRTSVVSISIFPRRFERWRRSLAPWSGAAGARPDSELW